MIRTAIVALVALVALTVAGCSSSGPSPAMQKWNASAGGKCLTQIEQTMTATNANSVGAVENFAMTEEGQANRCVGMPPPVEGDRYAKIMADIAAADLFGITEMTDTSASAADGARYAAAYKRAIADAEALAKSAPADATWAPTLAKDLGSG
jgi:hypothetical protein